MKATAPIWQDPGISPEISPLLPILGNPDFQPGLTGSGFSVLWKAGKTKLTHFRKENTWLPLPDIQQLGDQPLGYWSAMQISHFLHSLKIPSEPLRSLTAFEQVCSRAAPIRHALSWCCKLIMQPLTRLSPTFVRAWEKDLGVLFEPVQISRMLSLALGSSISNRIQESGYKILTRWYRVPSTLHKIFPQTPDTCWRCGIQSGTMIHIFWECSVIQPFWTRVRTLSQQLTGMEVEFRPETFLLHLNSIPLKRYRGSLLIHLINAARTCIPALWKQSHAPTVAMWFGRVNEVMAMEDLTASLHDRNEQFYATWHAWIQFKSTQEYHHLWNA